MERMSFPKKKAGEDPLIADDFTGLTVTNNEFAFVSIGEGGRIAAFFFTLAGANYSYHRVFTQLPTFEATDGPECRKVAAASITFPSANQILVAVSSRTFGNKILLHSGNVGAWGMKFPATIAISLDSPSEIITNVTFVESAKLCLSSISLASDGKSPISALHIFDLNRDQQIWVSTAKTSFSSLISSLRSDPIFTHPYMRSMISVILTSGTRILLDPSNLTPFSFEDLWDFGVAAPKEGGIGKSVISGAVSPNRVGLCLLTVAPNEPFIEDCNLTKYPCTRKRSQRLSSGPSHIVYMNLLTTRI
ncbi:hypothetical protein BC829DRAFT_110921 [Chytridium lagenaria]|nr:hypothetical protein BC829DRAFT_110921 [Chytridium lagenaria]